MTPPSQPSSVLWIALRGSCECCEEIEAQADEILQRFTDEFLPPRQTTRSLCLIVRAGGPTADRDGVDDDLLHHVQALRELGMVAVHDDGTLVIPGALPHQSGAGH